MGVSFDYVLYEMDWFVFLENYNWCLMYSHGHKREWIKPGKEESGMKYKKVYDETNENWIDFMQQDFEAGKYKYVQKRNCFVLPRGK